MNTKLTIGQYYPAYSHIHKLDPRVKLAGVFIYIIMLFFASNFYTYALAALCLFLIIYISQVPFKYMLKGLKSIFFIMLFTVVLNILFTPGETVYFSFYFIVITKEGLTLAGKMAVRLMLMIMSSSVLTLTTTAISLTYAIEYFLRPFRKIGVPAQEIAMMMSIALRFIPTLLEELDKIMKAQIARGADFDTGGLIKKAKALVPLLVPLFVSAFRRAEELAIAMEARCYRPDIQRTRMKALTLRKNDMRMIAGIIFFILAMLVLRLI